MSENPELTPLQKIELEHGFVFGLPDEGYETGNARPILNVVCTNPVCPNRGHHVQLHEDTILPAHCGGCGTVLHCDHEWATTRERRGTIGNPVEVTYDYCAKCGTAGTETSTALPPVTIGDLPIGILDALNTPT